MMSTSSSCKSSPSPLSIDSTTSPCATNTKNEFSQPPTVDALIASYLEYEDSLLENENSFVEQPNDETTTTTSKTKTTTATVTKITRNTMRLSSSSSSSYLNDAAFGNPYPTTLKLRQYMTEWCYEQPMVFHRSIVPRLITRSYQQTCQYLGIVSASDEDEDDRDNIYNERHNFAFVSVTGALFGVLKSFVHWKPGDIIITSDMLYHSLMDALSYLQQQHGLRWIQVTTPRGAKLDDIYQTYETTLKQQEQHQQHQQHGSIKLLIVDHISSKPAVRFPVERICRLCRRYRIPTLVDGAHIPGSSTETKNNIDIPSTGATFYAVTFHKWCHTIRGGNAGGLYVNRRDIRDLQYDNFIDISSLVVRGGWADGHYGKNKNNNNVDADDHGHCSPGKPAVQLYLDHTSKPGMFTDALTQGIYDESTREYENLLVLPHCLKLVQQFRPDFQRHVRSLRWKTLRTLQQAWDLSDDVAMMWYGDRRQYQHKEQIDDTNTKEMSAEELCENDNIQTTTTTTNLEEANYCFHEIPMLSVPLPTKALLDATVLSFDNNNESDNTLLPKRLKLLKRHLVPRLWHEYAIEVPISIWKEELLAVRITLGRHVRLIDIERLGNAICDIIQKGIRL